jgi:hypothetical protein
MSGDDDREDARRNVLVIVGAWAFLIVAMLLGLVIWVVATR